MAVTSGGRVRKGGGRRGWGLVLGVGGRGRGAALALSLLQFNNR